MSQQRRPEAKKILLREWTRWMGIVELFARRRRGRKSVDPQRYTELRRELLERCRTLAEASNEVEAPFYRYLDDLIQPWLDPITLARADQDILYDLLMRCQHIHAQLGGRSWCRQLKAYWPALLGTMLFSITLLCMGRFLVSFNTVIEFLRDGFNQIYVHIAYSSGVDRLFVIGCVLVAIAMIAVSRTAKS